MPTISFYHSNLHHLLLEKYEGSISTLVFDLYSEDSVGEDMRVKVVRAKESLNGPLAHPLRIYNSKQAIELVY